MNLIKELFQKTPLAKRDIFAKISGHENIKNFLRNALKADDTIHVNLIGPPGIGKTRFLKAIEAQYPDKSLFISANGALTTGQGLADELFRIQPKYLLMDEIEYFNKSDQATLFTLMQDHRLVDTKVKNGGRRELSLNCTVFATCNSAKKLSAPLTSRFVSLVIEGYTQEQFMSVSIELLQNKVEPGFAEFIASNVWKTMKSPNIRDCERIAAMCHSEEDVLEYLRMVKQ